MSCIPQKARMEFCQCRRLTELRQDVIETRDTIKQVLDTDQLAGLCLSELQESGVQPGDLPSSSESMREAALLLQSYERQISTVEGALKVNTSPPRINISQALQLYDT
jgi:hypothetical protein